MAVIELYELAVPGRLAPVSLTLEAGRVLGVIGPNGSGKSTLLQAIAGVLHCSGRAVYRGQVLSAMKSDERARRIALQPQFVEVAWSLPVRSVVALGRLPWGDEDEERIDQAMTDAGVFHLADRAVDRLSGGEQARVWLARLLAHEPELWLADEPIVSLDLKYQRMVLDRLRRYADDGGSVMLAIHDLALAARYCDRLCLLDGMGGVRTGTVEDVMQESVLSRAFDVPLRVDLGVQPPIVMAR